MVDFNKAIYLDRKARAYADQLIQSGMFNFEDRRALIWAYQGGVMAMVTGERIDFLCMPRFPRRARK